MGNWPAMATACPGHTVRSVVSIILLKSGTTSMGITDVSDKLQPLDTPAEIEMILAEKLF